MKYFFISVGIIIFMLMVDQVMIETKTDSDNQKELDDMLEVLDHYDLKLENYQTIIKESRKIDDIDKIASIMEEFQLIEQDENSIKFERDRQESTAITESVLLVRVNEKESLYQIIYTITATDSTPTIRKDYHKQISTITNDLFTENAQTFTCVEGWNNGIIDIVCLKIFLSERLNMTIIDEINDASIQSWTGYIPDWKNTWKQQDNEINMQIAVREGVADRTTLTIGTPILIHEY
ncbi:YwmB family TATA-box binding protein [Gracilibacillus sp. S3-1-1]|uniref:YwmB family TATA-box binding protein n=1 Tax=Gracilibacillus pellucidus TaxID=3095368 RepID=A0ACC6M9Z3_9BACI|nr:YwmB family TATA-box binding protein [Gracilibacillus sp. S3-1-1]MDX8047622.1 YwmB family TATA-box binding protein [Gracilibacillus sp. S3-1-1]